MSEVSKYTGRMVLAGDWVPDVTFEAMRRLLEHADKVGLPNTDEFTLRALFMAAAHDELQPAPTFQTEWHRFDLLLQRGQQATVIEFKYYLQRRTLGLQGEHLGFKGGPGPKNEAEFKACVHKLRTTALPGVDDRRLILVYEKQSHNGSRYSFNRSYQDLAVGGDLADVQKLTVDQLEARVLRPRLDLATADSMVRYPE